MSEVQLRKAEVGDCGCLAALNQFLIEDEGHQNRTSLAELEGRMRSWLVTREYKAYLMWASDQIVGYLLIREIPDQWYLRHFFVDRKHRRKGHGRAAVRQLFEMMALSPKPLRLDVLSKNKAALAFWRACGFSSYCVTLEKR
jgi:predicted acetyltransferase